MKNQVRKKLFDLFPDDFMGPLAQILDRLSDIPASYPSYFNFAIKGNWNYEGGLDYFTVYGERDETDIERERRLIKNKQKRELAKKKLEKQREADEEELKRLIKKLEILR